MWDGVRRKELLKTGEAIDKSRFNRTGFPFDKESRRADQFKFFGYRPKRFISVYAKKPRILVKPKVDDRALINLGKWRAESVLYNAQMDRQMNINKRGSLSNLYAQGMQNVGMGGYDGNFSAANMQIQLAADHGMQQAQMAANRSRAIADMQIAACVRLF
jgi:hypothetical protein